MDTVTAGPATKFKLIVIRTLRLELEVYGQSAAEASGNWRNGALVRQTEIDHEILDVQKQP